MTNHHALAVADTPRVGVPATDRQLLEDVAAGIAQLNAKADHVIGFTRVLAASILALPFRVPREIRAALEPYARR